MQNGYLGQHRPPTHSFLIFQVPSPFKKLCRLICRLNKRKNRRKQNVRHAKTHPDGQTGLASPDHWSIIRAQKLGTSIFLLLTKTMLTQQMSTIVSDLRITRHTNTWEDLTTSSWSLNSGDEAAFLPSNKRFLVSALLLGSGSWCCSVRLTLRLRKPRRQHPLSLQLRRESKKKKQKKKYFYPQNPKTMKLWRNLWTHLAAKTLNLWIFLWRFITHNFYKPRKMEQNNRFMRML